MRKVFVVVLAVAGALALVPQSAHAACPTLPGRSSDEGRKRIRSSPIVVYGRIAVDAPPDAHGAYSFFLEPIQTFSGSLPAARIQVTSYGEPDRLHRGFEQPGNRRSVAGTREFLQRYGGQEAILFLAPDDARGRDPQGLYRGQYATTGCTYNQLGAKDVGVFLPLVRQIFRVGAPRPGGQPGGGAPTGIPTGSLPPDVKRGTEDDADDRGGAVVRAATLALLVAGAHLLYASPKSPLFERWRAASNTGR